nr:MAG TPA: hypothetical protein [Siphovirus LN-2020-2]
MDGKPVNGVHDLLGGPVAAEGVIGLVQILLQVLELVNRDIAPGQICRSHGHDLIVCQTEHQLSLGIVSLGSFLKICPDPTTRED